MTVPVNPAVVEKAFTYLKQSYDAVIVEGTGGILVPIRQGYLVADLISDLGLPVIIAARSGLGTINHTLLTVSAAVQADLKVAGVVLNRYPSKPGIIEKDNPKAITAFCGVPVIALVPEIEGLVWEIPERALLEKVAERVNEKYRLTETLANQGGVL